MFLGFAQKMQLCHHTYSIDIGLICKIFNIDRLVLGSMKHYQGVHDFLNLILLLLFYFYLLLSKLLYYGLQAPKSTHT